MDPMTTHEKEYNSSSNIERGENNECWSLTCNDDDSKVNGIKNPKHIG